MNRNKKKKLPTSNIVKILSATTIIILIFELILLILGIISKSIAYSTWIIFLRPIRTFIYVISQFFAFKIGTFSISLFYIMIFLVLIAFIVYEIVIRNEKIKKNNKIKIMNFIKCFEIIVFLLEFGLYLIPQLMTYNNPNIDTIYFKKEVKKKYTKDDIIDYSKKIEDKIIEIGKTFERDKDGNIIYDGKLENIAVNDMKKAGERYDFLKGIYPKRYLKFNKKELEKTSTLHGVTTIDVVNINYTKSIPKTLNIISHELCHTKGVVRENEAVLCSVMVGIESDNELSNYAAYLESYERIIEAISSFDSEAATRSEDRISMLCVDNGYKEICDLYNKETEIHIEDAKEIEIGTYNTSYYDKGFLEKLIEEIEPFNPTYYVDGKKINSDEIYENIDENKHLSITVDNSKENFEKIQEILKKYKDDLQYVSQITPNDYQGVTLTEEEAEEYYTSEVPESNATIHINGNIEETFDYSRATRLIMEYFDHENL